MARAGLAASRAIELIDFLAARGTTPYTVSELARELAINVASCHAILQGLTRTGHLSRHPKHKTYTLGPALVASGRVAARNHPVIARVEAAAGALSRRLGLEALVTMRAGDEVLGLADFQVDPVSRGWLRTGQRLPLCPPFGATFVAWEGEEEIGRWIGRGFAGDVDADLAAELRRVLTRVREHGYQVALRSDARTAVAGLTAAAWEPAPYVDTMRARMGNLKAEVARLFFDPAAADDDSAARVDFMTAPVFDAHGRALYAVTLYHFGQEMDGERARHALSELLSMAMGIRREFGG